MKKLNANIAIITLAVFSFVSTSLAHEFKIGDMEIGHPYARAMLPGAKVGGGYLKLTNEGSADDRLLSATSERAGSVQLHEMKIENDVMTMRALDGGIAVPKGQTVELKPGGYHVMFVDVKQPFKEGKRSKPHSPSKRRDRWTSDLSLAHRPAVRRKSSTTITRNMAIINAVRFMRPSPRGHHPTTVKVKAHVATSIEPLPDAAVS
ncbi:copper chaperone PCu(A)C [Rhizobium sp. 32-5/1]|uniref:copper chaperone PCu(A)C n=1 Tax=Rhizobium sp. 32-5/1 TaxID=3019602 RepID=UPI0032B84635